MGALAARATVLVAAAAVVAVTAGGSAQGNTGGPIRPISANSPWTTVFRGTMAGMEGLTSDNHGNLYVAEKATGSNPCPVWKISATSGHSSQVGFVPGPCSPEGLAFGPDGRLYVSGGDGPALDQVDALTPGDASTEATVFATGVPQANGLAFDQHGNLWMTDGVNAQGIVYRVGPNGGAAHEVFRVPLTMNSLGVGRSDVPLNGSTPEAGVPQNITANGIVVTKDGDLIVSDTSRGALWQVRLSRSGQVESPMGCDSTYAADALCLSDVFTESPYLVGVDGIVMDTAGRIWADANERQAIVVVTPDGRPTEFFRNPVDPTTGRRNNGPLEVPSSPVLLGDRLCTTDYDLNRGDNFPNTGGEVAGTSKINCLDQSVPATGVQLPVR